MGQFIAYAVVLLIAIAGGIGYFIGTSTSEDGPDPTELHTQIEEQSDRIQELETQIKAMQLSMSSRTYAPSTSTSAPAAPSPEPVSEYAVRAEKDEQVFTDRTGRELIATIIEVRADSVKVKRVADGRTFDIKHTDLIAEDRAFLEYLWKQQGPKPKSNQSTGEVDWDAIFGQ